MRGFLCIVLDLQTFLSAMHHWILPADVRARVETLAPTLSDEDRAGLAHGLESYSDVQDAEQQFVDGCETLIKQFDTSLTHAQEEGEQEEDTQAAEAKLAEFL
jgi:soluble cytochrome b562